MAELKPCPFCGRIPVIEDCGENRYFVRCKCGIAQDKLYWQKCDAVRRWNTRKEISREDASSDLIFRKAAMESLKKEYNRRFLAGDRGGLKLAWIEKAVNDVEVPGI